MDNIPGVTGIGEKTAARLIAQFGSIENLLENTHLLKGKLRENLKKFADQALVSKQLATILVDVPLPFEPEKLKMGEPDRQALKKLFEELEFRTFAKRFFTWLSLRQPEGTYEQADLFAEPEEEDIKTIHNTPHQYHLVDTPEKTNELAKDIRKQKSFCFDTETTSLDPMQAELVGLSFAVDAYEAIYIPVGHNYPGAPVQLDRETVLRALKPLLEGKTPKKVGQHIKYDMNVLSRYGLAVQGVAFDTMLESYVLNSTGSRHDMDSLALKYLGHQTTHYEELTGKGAKQIPFSQVSVEDAGHYAAEDADITLRLHQHLWPKLQAEPALQKVLAELEIPLIPVLARMEQAGVLIDGKLLLQQSSELAKRMLELEGQAHAAAGQPFNLGSPRQLQQILFEKLELPVIRKTPKGQPSTAEDVLKELADDYELPRLILEHRSISKLKSTYTDKLPQQINPHTGRVHTSYHQAVAATGRLSSSNPNLQNIPIRTPLGRKIRKAFVAPPGNLILAADYSQIELRIMAHLSGDKGLLKAFHDGVDVHRATAGEVFGEDYASVSGDQRRAAKAINFGLMYGMSAFGLARQLNISRPEAQEYMDTYFSRYPGVQAFMQHTREQAREQGYVETLFGRRLYLPEINAGNMMRRQGAERAAINAPMQGTAADIIKIAMISVDDWLQTEKPGARLIMQVHDELVLEVEQVQLESVRATVIQHMSSAADLDVPLVVDADSGPDWDTAH